MSKKTPKVKSRWQPLEEGVSTMQVIVIPDVDDHTFHFDDISKEELMNLSKFIDQSNKTLEVENMLFERYLTRMDPSALVSTVYLVMTGGRDSEMSVGLTPNLLQLYPKQVGDSEITRGYAKMNQILEAAALALQKAERAGQLGSGASTLSITREGFGSRLTDDSSSSSKPGTAKSGSSPVAKLGIFGFDKGGKLPAGQKIEIVNREVDELRNILESFRKKARKFNHVLRCRNEEMTERLQEITEAQKNFEQKLLIDSVDAVTGKLPGEKFLRYLEIRLKAEEMEIDKMRIKTGTLRAHLKRIKQQLAQKEELGEILHAVDFEQLNIENRECQEELDTKISHVNDVKRINGRFGTLLNVHKRKLNDQVQILSELQQSAVLKDKVIKKLDHDEEKVNGEVDRVLRSVNKITWLMKSYTVPDVIDYIKKKAEVHDIKKEIKVHKRQMKLRDMALTSQVQKIRSMNEGLSRSQTYGSAGSSAFKSSRIFF